MPDVMVGSVPAYLAVPSGSAGPAASGGPWPGVVVLHEAFGLNADIRGHADRLAALGYLALAPDLCGGQYWVRCMRSTFRQLRAGSGPAFDAIDASRGWLAERADCTSRKPATMTRLAVLARLGYSQQAAEDAWQRIFAFFGEYLR